MKPWTLTQELDLLYSKGLEVTDDVSIVEHLMHPVYITEGSYTNIKVVSSVLALWDFYKGCRFCCTQILHPNGVEPHFENISSYLHYHLLFHRNYMNCPFVLFI